MCSFALVGGATKHIVWEATVHIMWGGNMHIVRGVVPMQIVQHVGPTAIAMTSQQASRLAGKSVAQVTLCRVVIEERAAIKPVR